MADDIETRAKLVIQKLSGVPAAELRDDRPLGNKGRDRVDLDSLDRVALAMALEDEFHIAIPDEDVDRTELGTVGGLIDFVKQSVAARAAKFDAFKEKASAASAP